MLVLVVGPSGAGKDALLNAAREAFRGDEWISFARRVITRPPDPDGEAHEAVTEAEFAGRDFALSWSAHGLHYGISTEAVRTSPVVVANVSRGVIAETARHYQVCVIEVTAPPEILAARLAARGRETAGDVARRLARTVAIPDGVAKHTVCNDSTLAEGAARFIAALRRVMEESPR